MVIMSRARYAVGMNPTREHIIPVRILVRSIQSEFRTRNSDCESIEEHHFVLL